MRPPDPPRCLQPGYSNRQNVISYHFSFQSLAHSFGNGNSATLVLSEASALFHKNTGGRYSPHHLPSVFNDLRSLCEPPSKGQIAIQAAADSSAYKVPEHRQVAGEQKRAARRICPSLRPTNAAKPLQNSANPCSSLRKGTEYSFALLRADAILRFVKEPVVSAGRIFFAALQLAQGAFETPGGFL